jgi:hypothetical protein
VSIVPDEVRPVAVIVPLYVRPCESVQPPVIVVCDPFVVRTGQLASAVSPMFDPMNIGRMPYPHMLGALARAQVDALLGVSGCAGGRPLKSGPPQLEPAAAAIIAQRRIDRFMTPPSRLYHRRASVRALLSACSRRIAHGDRVSIGATMRVLA